MKRILINATHAEEIRVALCKDSHVYDFDLENRTREQKKANIYKGHVTRVEPSLEAVFVEYGSERQGFLSIREIAKEYLSGDPRNCKNIREVITEGTELLVQVEKEERGNKGAALSTYISLAGRYLVLMPNNSSGGGISRQISGSVRDEMKRMLSKLKLPKGMSIIIRTAGIGRTQEDLQNDLNHLLDIWKNINHTAQNTPSPCLTHREAGVVTRAVRDYLRDDIGEVWIDNEQAYNEAYHFVQAVMPHQVNKLRKYLDFEPMFSNFGVEAQIETAYQREVKLPSGGSIVIDQTEALVSIDINSAKATRGADVESTAHNTNLEAADEIARQLRLRDMGGLVVIDFIDMLEEKHRKDVEQRIKDATQHDRARIQFTQISRFGLLEMSRQRLRPSLEEATGYPCPRCHGNGMIRDLRSLSLSIMRNIEKIALKEGRGEVQVEVPIEIGAFLLNEKRDSLVYLEQDSGARITILPHAHLETPKYNITFNHAGFAPSSYERVNDTQDAHTQELGYDTNWQTNQNQPASAQNKSNNSQKARHNNKHSNNKHHNNKNNHKDKSAKLQNNTHQNTTVSNTQQKHSQYDSSRPEVCAWLSNLFTAPTQAQTSDCFNSADAASAIESHINNGGVSRGTDGNIDIPTTGKSTNHKHKQKSKKHRDDNRKHKRDKDNTNSEIQDTNQTNEKALPRRDANSKRPSRGERNRNKNLETPVAENNADTANSKTQNSNKPQRDTNKNKSKNSKQKPRDQVFVNVTKSETSTDSAKMIHIDVETGAVQESELSSQAGSANKKPHKPSSSSVQENTTRASRKNAISHDAVNIEATHAEAVSEKPPAHTLGRAKNDPRNLKAATNTVAVSGTLLSYVHNVFAEEADSIIQEKGLINSFIQALNLQEKNTATEYSETVFQISDEEKASYLNAITAVASHATDAGTSDAQAPSAAYRASNDPRGRIAGFETIPESLLANHITHNEVSTTDENRDENSIEKPESLNQAKVTTVAVTQNKFSLVGVTAGELIQSILDDADEYIEKTSFEAALLKSLNMAQVTQTHSDIQMATHNLQSGSQETVIASDVTESTEINSSNIELLSNELASSAENSQNQGVEVTADSSKKEESTTETEKNPEAPKKPRGRPRKKPVEASATSDAKTDEEKAKKPKKAPATRQRRTSKKASADKVIITKKATESIADANKVPTDNSSDQN